MSEMCATPVYNVGGNDGIFGGCGGSYWILILFFLFAFGRGGFGGWGSMEILEICYQIDLTNSLYGDIITMQF